MTYTYDQKHATLIVEQDKTADGVTPVVLVQMDHQLGPSSAIHVQPEDAPAVALAILEAAGVDYERYVTMPPASDDIDELCACAAQTLRLAVRQRANKAEREAEDAKVRNFRTHQWKAQDENRAEVMPLWDNLSNYERDLWRTEYRAARKFFGEEQ